MSEWLVALSQAIAFMGALDVLPRGALPPSARVVLAFLLTPLLAHRHVEAGSLWQALLHAGLASALCGLSISVLTAAARAAGSAVDNLMGGGFLGRDLSSQGAAFELLYGYAFALVFVASGAFASSLALLLALPDHIAPAPHFVTSLVATSYRHALGIAGPALGIQCAVSGALGIFGRLSPHLNGMFLTSPLTAVMLLIVIVAGGATWWHQFVALALAATAVSTAVPGR